MNDEALGAALRGLPLEAPATSAWAELERTLVAQGIARRPAAWRRYALPAALAAALALFLVWPALVKTPTPAGAPSDNVATTTRPDAAVATATATQPPVDRLRDESRRIENWLRQASASGTPLDGADLMATAEIQDMIGLIDLQLSGASDTGTEAAALWRQRVDLLRDLAAIRTTAYSLAETGVAANGAAASPDTWIN